MSRVLVTGGAGFIGSHVVDELLGLQQEVFVVDNFFNGKKEFLGQIPEENIFKVDIRDRRAMEKVFATVRPSMVFHLAAIHFIPYCNEHPFESSQINILGTRLLLDLIQRQGGVKKLFFTSTAAVYPIADLPHKEGDVPGPMDIYGITKLVGEDLVRLFVQQSPKTAAVIGRLFNAVGPRETNPHLLPQLVAQLRAGKRQVELGNLEPRRDFLHVSDMAKAIVFSTMQVESGLEVFNIGSGQSASVREVVEGCEKILQAPIQIIQKENLVRKVERLNLVADIAKIQSVIPWRPTRTLESTLRELLLD